MLKYNIVLCNISFLFVGNKICLALNNVSALIYVTFKHHILKENFKFLNFFYFGFFCILKLRIFSKTNYVAKSQN